MTALAIELELLTDVAVTARSATVGGHESLAYIPGASLLGAVAAQKYPKSGTNDPTSDTFRLFHGGVRFGNALPVSCSGRVALPVPLSFHHPKGSDAFRDLRGGRSCISGNVASRTEERSREDDNGIPVQWKQVRSVFIDNQGWIYSPHFNQSLRTSIQSDSGRAREGYLLSLSSISAGTRLRAIIESSDATLIQLIRDTIVNNTIRIGRSRSAEFGRALVREVALDEAKVPEHGKAPNGVFKFWCVSDLCLRDPSTGQPTFEPSAAHFRLPVGCVFEPSQSFLRTRTYTPFNSKRMRPDLDRQVLAAGSVLTFRGDLNDPTLQSLRETLAQGVGEYTHEGLGVVVFNPEILEKDWIASIVQLGAPPPVKESEVILPASDPLGLWLETRWNSEVKRQAAWDIATDWLKHVGEMPPWLAIPASQWGEIRKIAKVCRVERQANASVHDKVQQHCAGSKGVTAQRWSKPWRDQSGTTPTIKSLSESLICWVKQVEAKDATVATMALELFANRIVRRVKQRKLMEGAA